MHFAQRLLLPKHLQHMPGNRLALAVGVGGQDQLVGMFDGVGDLVDALLRALVDVPGHGEVVVRLDRTVLGGEVADMAETGENFVAGAKIFVDGLGFGRGFNNENVHAISCSRGLRVPRQGREPRKTAVFGGSLGRADTDVSGGAVSTRDLWRGG